MSPQHLRSLMLTFATKKLSTGANGQKEDAASFFCQHSSDRAVVVAQWYDLQLEMRERDAGDPGSNPALGKQWSRYYLIDVPATPTLPDANLCYQEALDWRKWTKGGCSFHLLSAQF